MRAYRELRTPLWRGSTPIYRKTSPGVEVVQLFNRQQRNLRDFDAEHLPYRRAEDREIHCFARPSFPSPNYSARSAWR